MRNIVLVLAALCLGSCVTPTRDYYGSGPLPNFAPEVRAEIATYFSTQTFDRALAVTGDGQQALHIGCLNSQGFYRCEGDVGAFAVTNCERLSKKPCSLYAVDNRVVWKGAPQYSVARP